MSGTRSASPRAPATESEWAASTLLLVAHGIRGELGAASELRRLLEACGRFRSVHAACHRGAPDLDRVLDGLDAERLLVTPLLMADGWTLEAIARRLAAHPGVRECSLAPAVGSHPDLWRLVHERALGRCTSMGWEPAETTLLLAAHGTPRHPGAAQSAAAQAERLDDLGAFALVRWGFLDQEPGLEEVVASLGPGATVVAGFFFDNGPHGRDDVAAALERATTPVAYLGAIGADPGILPFLLDRLRLARPLPILA